jgi:hypothetical protein
MTERFAIYYAPAADSGLWQEAENWLAQEDLLPLTMSARRYGFHATLKAPMALAGGTDRAQLEMALAAFASRHGPVEVTGVAPRLIGGFLALTSVPQPQVLTDFAATVVTDFERFRAPLDDSERERRLEAPLTARQIELLDEYGYPYVLEEFLFHMTLTDRLPIGRRDELAAAATGWFAGQLARPMMLDRLVLFHEAAPGEPFRRLDDFVLEG